MAPTDYNTTLHAYESLNRRYDDMRKRGECLWRKERNNFSECRRYNEELSRIKQELVVLLDRLAELKPEIWGEDA